jgi:prepilin peptidase CpaA
MMVIIFLTLILVTAAVIDARYHKIPNWLTYPTMIGGIGFYAVTKGFDGFLFSIEGIGVGLAVLIFPYLMGGMGAGDTKLMGAIGGLLGPNDVFTAFLFTALVGGIYAVVLLISCGCLLRTVSRYGRMLKTLLLTTQFCYIPAPNGKTPRLYYGVAIASGTLLSIVLDFHFV